jgi:hypothetical protein
MPHAAEAWRVEWYMESSDRVRRNLFTSEMQTRMDVRCFALPNAHAV